MFVFRSIEVIHEAIRQ
jgi:putative transposase